MQKLLFITPHLSTGGQPQYLYKQIESLINDYEVYCIEWDNHTGGKLVVQRNRIEAILGKRLITLGEDKNWVLNEIVGINPDIIHFQELPEYFIPYELALRIYKVDRKYKIIETSHDSGFDINGKLHFPDRFLMVSDYQVNKFKQLGIPTELVEYPIETKTKTRSREEILTSLGLDPNLKHVINVGLFTPRKNQAEIIEYAKQLKDYPIQFHFIGNQADNFRHYWEPIMKDFPSNCKWWGERSDVDTFYEMADLFLFTSRGHSTDKETMPLVIREAIGWNIPSLIYNLDVYLGYFDKYNNIKYLNFSNKNLNKTKIIDILKVEKTNHIDYENISSPNDKSYDIYAHLFEKVGYNFLNINDKDVVYDLGANVGVFSLWINNKKSAKQIYAFEPTPSVFTHLNANLNSYKNTKIFELAISDKEEVKNFFTFKYSVANTLTDYGEYLNKENFLEKIEVNCINLEKFAYHNNLELPTVIKCDIEGAEYSFINSTSSKFYKNLKYFILEWHENYSGDKIQPICDKFSKLGFKIIKTYDPLNNEMGTIIFEKEKQELRECIIISTYTKNEAISDLTKKCIEESKKFNLPIILTSHCEIPQELQKMVNYCVTDSNNILTKHTHYSLYWIDQTNFYAKIQLKEEGNDIYHGPAVYTNYYNGLSLAKMLNFNKAYCYNFDVILNNSIPIELARDAFDESYKGLMNLYSPGEGMALRTVYHAIDIDFFFDYFPIIKNEKDYTDWYISIGAESNGLENMYYHNLKSNLDNLKLINSDEFYNMFENNKIDVCSQVEYFTLLPIKNEKDKAIIWFSSQHKADNRLIKVYLNGSLLEEIKIKKETIYTKEISLKDAHSIKIEIYDNVSNKLLSNKQIDINDNYLIHRLPNNGIFIKKQ